MLAIKILSLLGFIALIDCFQVSSPERNVLRHQCRQSSRTKKLLMTNSDQVPSSPYDLKRKNFGLFVKIASAAFGSSLIDSRPSIAVDLPECSDSVTVFQRSSDKKSVILIGTAHISEDSVNLVRRTIRSVKPDVVMIELDSKRIGRAGISQKTLNEAGFDLPILGAGQLSVAALQTSVSEEKAKAFVNLMVGTLAATVQDWISDTGGALLGRALSEFYKSIEKLGFTPGGEFKAAVEEGRAIGARILLGDRDVDFTLQRLAAAVSNTDTAAFDRAITRIAAIEQKAGIDFSDPNAEMTKETLNTFLESVKEKDLLTTVMHVVRDEIPLVHAALVGERDMFMAEAIASSPGKNMVGVVGMAHMEGMEAYLTQRREFRVVRRNCPAPFSKKKKAALVSEASNPSAGAKGVAGVVGVGDAEVDPFAQLGDIPIISISNNIGRITN